LTILAPCILPVVPFVFARIDKPFFRNGLPLLVGMAATFAAVSTLGAVAGGWAVAANDYGRMAAIALLSLMGVALLVPRWAERVTRPLVMLGSRISNAATPPAGQGAHRGGVWTSLVLGVATGFLWAPCAGPILGLFLTSAALQGPSVRTSLLLLAYGAGAVTSLALALLAGGRVLAVMKRSLGIGEWVRKGLGVAVLIGVGAVALGLDTGLLAQGPIPGGAAVEQRLFERLVPTPVTAPERTPVAISMPASSSDESPFLKVQARPDAPGLPSEGPMPPIGGAVEWLNSPPLSAQQLRGKVVLVDFWTFGCINCRNALPHVREWHRKYKDQGLVVIGVHTPEFAYEKNIANVKRALSDLDVSFPVAVDNDFAIWRSFQNNYWPAHYFIDAKGQIRFHHFGEGEYDRSERVIQQLIEEARKDTRPL
jgi:cytochrome c biogenesis protein CcdA/thiol-disulfide isomerase/thioredoxin